MDLQDDDSGPWRQQGQWPHIRKTELYSNAAEITGQRLRHYLRVMGLPAELVMRWQERVQHDEENAVRAFGRLRLLIAEHGLEGAKATSLDDTDASVMPRLYSWFGHGQIQSLPWVERLCINPPIHRKSMAPEDWSE